jgi:hypothetical protein
VWTMHARMQGVIRSKSWPYHGLTQLAKAAAFVIRPHRLSNILNESESIELIQFLYRESDGDMDLPTLVREFYREQIAKLDSQR